MKKENKVFAVLQRVGRSFMLPIALLPVAGLLLGIGGSFTNQTLISAYGLSGILGENTILYSILSVLRDAGDIVFGNLPIIFAISVAIGMAKSEKATAALSGAVAFFVMHATIAAGLRVFDIVNVVDGEVITSLAPGSLTTAVGIQNTLQMGVFGGIIVGLLVAFLHNKFYKVEFTPTLSFFEGTRFIPIISALGAIVLGFIMVFIWPTVFKGITALGNLVQTTGYLGTFIYGYIERALIPFGLHHVFYLPFWQTAVGGTLEIGGRLVEGAQNIFFAQLADPNFTGVFEVAMGTRFMAGKFPFMMFGLPAAALAMYHTAKYDRKIAVKGLLFSAALTSFLTGITEPIEFTFLFVAPFLYYGIHAVLCGLSFMLMHIFNVGVGQTFSGGFIDFVLYGLLPGLKRTNAQWIIIVGIAYAIIYYVLFKTLILKLNLKTPGREDDGEESKLYTKKDFQNKQESKNNISASIAEGLGGIENIEDLDNCATRLRTTVKDPSLVNETLLKQTGASGVIKNGNGIQVIYGPKVSVIKSNLEEFIMENNK